MGFNLKINVWQKPIQTKNVNGKCSVAGLDFGAIKNEGKSILKLKKGVIKG